MSRHQRPTEIDLDAYFQRIGYRGDRAPTLSTVQAIHQHHARAIAFENLTPLLKQPVRLDLASLQQKLIQEGPWGYCFEQNSLLRAVLLALGFQVTGLAARVMWNVPEGTMTPRSHMVLRVQIDGESYIADVGFGGLTLTTPLAFIPDIEQQTSHEPFRFIAMEQAYRLDAFINQAWKPLYRFDLQDQHPPDYDVSNWYASTHPNSLFVTRLIAARPDTDCRYALLDHQFTVHDRDGRTERRILATVTELRTTLEDAFCLNLGAIAGLDQALGQVIERSATS